LLDNQSQTNKSKLHFYTKTDLVSHYYLPYKRPDAYIAIESKQQTKRYFLEIIDEGTPRFMIRSKIDQYLEYFQANTWQDRTDHLNPTMLFVCPDELTKIFLNKYILQMQEEEPEVDLEFFLTIKDQISNNQADLWEKVED